MKPRRAFATRVAIAFMLTALTESAFADDPKPRLTLKGHAAEVRGLSYSPDGKLLASAGSDQSIKLWDIATGKELATLNGGISLWSVVFSPDGKLLASGTHSAIKLWDVKSGKELTTIPGFLGQSRAVVFSPDGTTLASDSMDNKKDGTWTIALWDVKTGKRKATLKGHLDGPVDCLAYSPDGKTLASGCRDDTVKLWDVATGQEKATLLGHRNWVMSVSWSPDGKTLASGSRDHTIILWDVATAKAKATLKGPRSEVLCVAYSPDGKTLARCGDALRNDPGYVGLWDSATGRETARLLGHKSSEVFTFVPCVAWSPDGRTVASGGSDATILLWDIAPRSNKDR